MDYGQYLGNNRSKAKHVTLSLFPIIRPFHITTFCAAMLLYIGHCTRPQGSCSPASFYFDAKLLNKSFAIHFPSTVTSFTGQKILYIYFLIPRSHIITFFLLRERERYSFTLFQNTSWCIFFYWWFCINVYDGRFLQSSLGIGHKVCYKKKIRIELIVSFRVTCI